MVNIFSDDFKVKNNWWQKKAIGDKLQGTYIGKRSVFNTLRNADQIVYEIMTDEGDVWNVGGTAGIDAQMRNIKLGQIIGFEFVASKPATKPGMSPTKIVQVYANPTLVNKEWLESQSEEAAAAGEEMSFTNLNQGAAEPGAPEYIPMEELAAMTGGKIISQPEAPVQPTLDTTSLIMKINNLAVTKLGATTPEQVKDKTMEATKLAFIEANLPAILAALEALPANTQ